MFFGSSLTVVFLLLSMQETNACYQNCSSSFIEKIQGLVGIKDPATLTLRSCQAITEKIACLESQRPMCDLASLQNVNSIINFIRPDYERTCAAYLPSDNNSTALQNQLLVNCSHKAKDCFTIFNTSFAPAVFKMKNFTEICQSLDNYTTCAEDLMPECGQFMGQAVNYIRTMQQRHSYICSGSGTPQAVTECVNDTMDCYGQFNATFFPALRLYNLSDMCSAMDSYQQCLTEVDKRQVCQRYTKPALAGVYMLRLRYSLYCGTDGGQKVQSCLSKFQSCYHQFSNTYFRSVHTGKMEGVCSSVTNYSSCVQPLYSPCGSQISQVLASARVFKEQYAVQCNKDNQRLFACEPLMLCMVNIWKGFSRKPLNSANLCTTLESFFPCVESGLNKCQIPVEDTSVDFSQLGSLTGDYCQHLLGNGVLNSCPVFVTCTSRISLISSPDPKAMFNASTWCSYMDMSLSCVERAVNTPNCGLANDDTIRSHLTQQRELKRNICRVSSVSPISTKSPNVISEDGNSKSQGKTSRQTGDLSSGCATVPVVVSLAALAVLSLVI